MLILALKKAKEGKSRGFGAQSDEVYSHSVENCDDLIVIVKMKGK